MLHVLHIIPFDFVDFLWLNDQVLVSCSKDGKLIQQLFSDALRPVEKAVSAFPFNKYIFYVIEYVQSHILFKKFFAIFGQ